ncbi:hypothetical protein Leryth_022803 [Lithospermum erythrorhizon]|nr:hypothetical protein Leryth_022803 [Lithospermum erythrorhizon]
MKIHPDILMNIERFDYVGKESAIAPLWIRIEGLPLYLFDELSLLSIANAIEPPLSVPSFVLNSAFISVELDVSKALIDAIYVCFQDDNLNSPIEGFWIKVFYDVVSSYCSSYLHIGHSFEVSKKGKSAFLACIADTEQRFEKVLPASKVFDVLPLPTLPSITVTSSSTSANFNKKSEEQVKKIQVWKEVRGSGAPKTQKNTTSIKAKALPIENSFSPLQLTGSELFVLNKGSANEVHTVLQVENEGTLKVDQNEKCLSELKQQMEPATIIIEESVLPGWQLNTTGFWLHMLRIISNLEKGKL